MGVWPVNLFPVHAVDGATTQDVTLFVGKIQIDCAVVDCVRLRLIAEASQKVAKGRAQKDVSTVEVKTGQPSLTPFADAASPVAVCTLYSLQIVGCVDWIKFTCLLPMHLQRLCESILLDVARFFGDWILIAYTARYQPRCNKLPSN